MEAHASQLQGMLQSTAAERDEALARGHEMLSDLKQLHERSQARHPV
jgi:hypothetical protein